MRDKADIGTFSSFDVLTIFVGTSLFQIGSAMLFASMLRRPLSVLFMCRIYTR